MLTNFFGKSNPINFFVCAMYLLLALLAAVYEESSKGIFTMEMLIIAGVFLLLLFTMLLLDFIIRKNALTQINTFAIFLLVCFVAAVPVIFTELDIVGATVFILLALRRIVSLGSERNVEKKLFDASLYIMIAALFHFWCVLFLLPMYWAITKISTQNFRLFFIPIAGIVTVLILGSTYHLLRYDSLAWFSEWIALPSFDFSAYNNLAVLIPSAVMSAMFLWVLVVRLLKASSVPRKLQANYKTLTLVMILSLIVIALSPIKSGSELIFVMAPLAIATTNYMERVNDFWFREMLLWLFALLPFGLFFLFEI